MRILHTSDWHLGRTLYNRARYEEFEAFLNWLAEILEREQIDVLLVAGDIFDNTTPSHRAQALYYQFLHAIANSACRHVVVIAGNHDSPSLLDAPQALLRYLNVHVLGGASDNPADEVLSL
ncbi:MAG: exonuclease subunit SbcD, partial [Candidatus Competibacteraceae bacterium]|nr:exonuclease subunit SbcD [Candidatus Competibacteraceae bacterium]